MANPTYLVEVEWVSGSFTNITPDVRGISISRDAADFDNPIQEGRLTLDIDNYDGRYSPINTSSPLYAYLKPYKNVMVRAIYGLDGQGNPLYHTIFKGITRTYGITSGVTPTATIDCVDDFYKLSFQTWARSKLSWVYNDLFAEIVTNAGMTSYAVPDTTFTGYVNWSQVESDKTAAQALKKLIESTYGAVFMSQNSGAVFLNRYYSVGKLPSNSYEEFFGLRFDSKFNVLNKVAVSTIQYIDTGRSDYARVNEWSSGTLILPTSMEITFDVSYGIQPGTSIEQYLGVDPLIISSPANSLSIIANTNPAGTGTDFSWEVGSLNLISEASRADKHRFVLTHGYSTPLYVTALSIYGRLVIPQGGVEASYVNTSSVALYGEKFIYLNNDWVEGYGTCKDYATFLGTEYSEPTIEVAFSLRDIFPDVLDNELYDMVHITNTPVGLYRDVLITGIHHTIDPRHGSHTVEYSTREHKDRGWLLLGNSSLGLLDTGKMGF